MKNELMESLNNIVDLPGYVSTEIITRSIAHAFDTWANITVAKEVQLTERTKIREQSRVMIAAYEADTKKFMMALEMSARGRMELIGILGSILRDKDIDEYTVEICRLILQELGNSEPLKGYSLSTFK